MSIELEYVSLNSSNLANSLSSTFVVELVKEQELNASKHGNSNKIVFQLGAYSEAGFQDEYH